MPSRSRIVLLTGAAGGIGRVMTRALLRGGHCVAAADRDAASLERLKSLCDRTERLCPIVADLSTETGCAHAIEIARERFGTIEALVNNAGIGMSVIRPDAEVSHPRHRGADTGDLGSLLCHLRARTSDNYAPHPATDAGS